MVFSFFPILTLASVLLFEVMRRKQSSGSGVFQVCASADRFPEGRAVFQVLLSSSEKGTVHLHAACCSKHWRAIQLQIKINFKANFMISYLALNEVLVSCLYTKPLIWSDLIWLKMRFFSTEVALRVSAFRKLSSPNSPSSGKSCTSFLKVKSLVVLQQNTKLFQNWVLPASSLCILLCLSPWVIAGWVAVCRIHKVSLEVGSHPHLLRNKLFLLLWPSIVKSVSQCDCFLSSSFERLPVLWHLCRVGIGTGHEVLAENSAWFVS